MLFLIRLIQLHFTRRNKSQILLTTRRRLRSSRKTIKEDTTKRVSLFIVQNGLKLSPIWRVNARDTEERSTTRTPWDQLHRHRASCRTRKLRICHRGTGRSDLVLLPSPLPLPRQNPRARYCSVRSAGGSERSDSDKRFRSRVDTDYLSNGRQFVGGIWWMLQSRINFLLFQFFNY